MPRFNSVNCFLGSLGTLDHSLNPRQPEGAPGIRRRGSMLASFRFRFRKRAATHRPYRIFHGEDAETEANAYWRAQGKGVEGHKVTDAKGTREDTVERENLSSMKNTGRGSNHTSRKKSLVSTLNKPLPLLPRETLPRYSKLNKFSPWPIKPGSILSRDSGSIRVKKIQHLQDWDWPVLLLSHPSTSSTRPKPPPRPRPPGPFLRDVHNLISSQDRQNVKLSLQQYRFHTDQFNLTHPYISWQDIEKAEELCTQINCFNLFGYELKDYMFLMSRFCSNEWEKEHQRPSRTITFAQKRLMQQGLNPNSIFIWETCGLTGQLIVGRQGRKEMHVYNPLHSSAYGRWEKLQVMIEKGLEAQRRKDRIRAVIENDTYEELKLRGSDESRLASQLAIELEPRPFCGLSRRPLIMMPVNIESVRHARPDSASEKNTHHRSRKKTRDLAADRVSRRRSSIPAGHQWYDRLHSGKQKPRSIRSLERFHHSVKHKLQHSSSESNQHISTRKKKQIPAATKLSQRRTAIRAAIEQDNRHYAKRAIADPDSHLSEHQPPKNKIPDPNAQDLRSQITHPGAAIQHDTRPLSSGPAIRMTPTPPEQVRQHASIESMHTASKTRRDHSRKSRWDKHVEEQKWVQEEQRMRELQCEIEKVRRKGERVEREIMLELGNGYEDCVGDEYGDVYEGGEEKGHVKDYADPYYGGKLGKD